MSKPRSLGSILGPIVGVLIAILGVSVLLLINAAQADRTQAAHNPSTKSVTVCGTSISPQSTNRVPLVRTDQGVFQMTGGILHAGAGYGRQSRSTTDAFGQQSRLIIGHRYRVVLTDPSGTSPELERNLWVVQDLGVAPMKCPATIEPSR